MKPINAYFEASDHAEFEITGLINSCRVSRGTVRAIEDGAEVIAVAPGAIAQAAVAGSSAVAQHPGSLALALVRGAFSVTSARGAYAQSWAVGALAEAYAPGSVAEAFFGVAVGHCQGAFVVLHKNADALSCKSLLCEGVVQLKGGQTHPKLPPFPSSKSHLVDGVSDLGLIIVHDYYREGDQGNMYPWHQNYACLSEPDTRGCSLGMTGPDILHSGKVYTAAGMVLRDAIRHAEILGDNVPDEACVKLLNLTWESRRKAADVRRSVATLASGLPSMG